MMEFFVYGSTLLFYMLANQSSGASINWNPFKLFVLTKKKKKKRE